MGVDLPLEALGTRKKTKSIRIGVQTHERLRKAKYKLEVDTFDEAVRELLDLHVDVEKGRER